MLASMSETTWSDVDMSELPTGTVTLLLADVEGSTRLWETQPEAMKSAVERLDQTLAEAVATHRGVRPVEQGEGDSFVIAFSRAADAVACALAFAASPAGTDQVAHRRAHRRRAPARRRQLHRPDDQPHRPIARPCARRPDRAVGCDRAACRRPTSCGRHAPRPRLTHAPGPPAPGTGCPAMPSRPTQRLPAAAHYEYRLRPRTSSGSAVELHRTPRPK